MVLKKQKSHIFWGCGKIFHVFSVVLQASTVQYRPSEKKIVFGLKVPSSDGLGKVIHTKYSKHCPSTVAHTFECVCSKINHGLNQRASDGR